MRHEAFRPLRDRSFRFALDIARFCRTLGETWEGRRVADQLFRCGTSVAANYRSAARARSPADFIAKMGIVVEETDESEFWLAFIRDAAIDKSAGGERLFGEAGELLAIFTASFTTAKENARRKRRERLAAKKNAVKPG
jgi:four helix bundle protein